MAGTTHLPVKYLRLQHSERASLSRHYLAEARLSFRDLIILSASITSSATARHTVAPFNAGPPNAEVTNVFSRTPDPDLTLRHLLGARASNRW